MRPGGRSRRRADTRNGARRRRSTMPPMHVRWATSADLLVVYDILDSAALWLQRRGIEQWPVPYPRGGIDRACAEQQLCVGEGESGVIATMRVARQDPEVW